MSFEHSTEENERERWPEAMKEAVELYEQEGWRIISVQVSEPMQVALARRPFQRKGEKPPDKEHDILMHVFHDGSTDVPEEKKEAA